MAGKSLFQELQELRPLMAKAAQKVYDEWAQDSEGIDEQYGAGGICDDISEAIGGVVAGNVSGVNFTDGGSDGDDHAFPITYRDGRAYGVDIPCRIYETGGGYRWKKRQGVVFKPEDIEIFEIPYPKEGFDMGKPSEGGINLRGNRFEADVAPNHSRADIKDRKNSKIFILLSREDLEELHELTGKLLQMAHD